MGNEKNIHKIYLSFNYQFPKNFCFVENYEPDWKFVSIFKTKSDQQNGFLIEQYLLIESVE